MAPSDDQALAQVGNQLYVVTVPTGVGAEAPTISVANPDNASFPASQLTDIGSQFPAWGPNAEEVHWALGNAHFAYNLDAAQAFADSIEALEDSADEDEEGLVQRTSCSAVVVCREPGLRSHNRSRSSDWLERCAQLRRFHACRKNAWPTHL